MKIENHVEINNNIFAKFYLLHFSVLYHSNKYSFQVWGLLESECIFEGTNLAGAFSERAFFIHIPLFRK